MFGLLSAIALVAVSQHLLPQVLSNYGSAQCIAPQTIRSRKSAEYELILDTRGAIATVLQATNLSADVTPGNNLPEGLR